jgi:hypothetical protein
LLDFISLVNVGDPDPCPDSVGSLDLDPDPFADLESRYRKSEMIPEEGEI